MKKVILLILVSILTYGCGSVAVGVANRAIVNNEDSFINIAEKDLMELNQLNLTENQQKESRIIYENYYTFLVENAKREKRGEITNRTSLLNFEYAVYKKQFNFVKLLDKNQLINYYNLVASYEIGGMSEKTMRKSKNHLKKRGFNVEF